MKRRRFLQTATAAGAAQLGCGTGAGPPLPPGPPGKSVVAVLRAASYSVDLLDRLRRGAALCGLQAKGKRVLLKPNLVEFDSATAINTNVAVIAAAVALFRELGAAEITIGEGPGHRRDTLFLAHEADYTKGIEKFDSLFVDLNRDDVVASGPFAGLPQIYLPATARRADLVVSLAKMKTHHWAVATLSMKNYFGLVPGAIYGWPKNQLHAVGIQNSIVELHRVLHGPAASFAIVDGIVGMEGNGPIQGKPKPAGVLVVGSDLVAVDSTCCRIMGIDPERVEYLRLAAARGHLLERDIDQRGESLSAVRTQFELLEDHRVVRLS
ncbi:MAG: DUF362 domain-containing protein [Bryobacteraceae bacterium]